MSQATIDILNTHRADQTRLSPSSELFTVSGGVASFYGVFDNSRLEVQKDQGNVLSKKQTPRIMVDIVPSGLEKNFIVTRENGEEYKVLLIEKDTEGMVPIWLY